MKKADTRESLERVRIVTEMRIRGYSTRDIIRYCADKWSLARRQAEEYIHKANQGMIEEASKDREELYAEAVAVNKDIREKAYKKLTPECMRIVLAANKENAELTGLKEVKVRLLDKEDVTGLEMLKKRREELIKECKEQVDKSVNEKKPS